jgi:hypothetical protein
MLAKAQNKSDDDMVEISVTKESNGRAFPHHHGALLSIAEGDEGRQRKSRWVFRRRLIRPAPFRGGSGRILNISRSAAGHDFLAIVGARLFRLEQVSGSKNPKTARNLVQAISRCREPAQPARINPFLDGDTGFRLEPEIS